MKVGNKRPASTSIAKANEPMAHRRRTESEDVVMDEPPSFIDKVRQDKERKLAHSQTASEPRATIPSVTTAAPARLSMAEYRASRGLSPVTGTSSNRVPLPPRQSSSSSGSSLFINRKKPPASVSSFNVRHAL